MNNLGGIVMSLKSRAAVIVEKERVEVRTIDIPFPQQGQILVRQRAVALCTLEQRFFSGIFSNYPGVWGHEVSGVVEAIGPGTYTPLQVGDRVARGGGSACGECYFCALGHDALCELEAIRRKNQQSSQRPDGIMGIFGMSEYAVMDTDNVVKISDQIPFAQAALTEPIACAVSSTNKLDVQLGQTVVVIGAGTMGLANILVLRQRGAFVVVSELDPARRKKALEAGAHAVLDPQGQNLAQQLQELNDGRLADAVVVTFGSGAANDDALRLVGPQGKIMLFASAHPAAPFTVDPNFIHNSKISITGSTSKNRKDLFQASLLIGRKIINVEPMIEKVLPLKDAQLAFEAAVQRESYRIVVTM